MFRTDGRKIFGRAAGKFSDGRNIFGRTDGKILDGRPEKIRTDGRTEKFRTDGRTENFRTDGRKIFGRTDGKISHATYGRIRPNVPGFISKPIMKRNFPGTFDEILRKVAGAIFGKMGL